MIDYIRNIRNMVSPLVAAVALYAATSCGSLQTQAEKPQLNPMQIAHIYSCPENQVSVFEEPHLRIIAGLLAGTVQARRTAEGDLFAAGEYREFEFPEAMVKACKLADRNKDGFIVNGEAETAAHHAMRYFADKAEAGK